MYKQQTAISALVMIQLELKTKLLHIEMHNIQFCMIISVTRARAVCFNRPFSHRSAHI